VGAYGVVKIGVLGIELGRIGLDGDRVGFAANGKDEVDLGGLVNGEDESGFGLLKALPGDLDKVGSGLQRGEAVYAVAIGLSLEDEAGVGAGEANLGVGNDGAGGVCDAAGDDTVGCLGVEAWRDAEDSQKDEDCESDLERME
jgi:hypothetical protein